MAEITDVYFLKNKKVNMLAYKGKTNSTVYCTLLQPSEMPQKYASFWILQNALSRQYGIRGETNNTKPHLNVAPMRSAVIFSSKMEIFYLMNQWLGERSNSICLWYQGKEAVADLHFWEKTKTYSGRNLKNQSVPSLGCRSLKYGSIHRSAQWAPGSLVLRLLYSAHSQSNTCLLYTSPSPRD